VFGFAGPARPVLAAAAAGALLLAAGCSDTTSDSGKPASSPTRPSGSPAAQPSLTAEQAAARSALTAYAGMWKEMQAAGVTANWKDPKLALYASGKALTTLVAGLQKAHNAGLVIKGTLVIRPQVISEQPASGPDTVVIRDCIDDSHWLSYVAATGKLQNNIPGGHRLTEAVLTKVTGQWSVSQLAVHAEGTC
jgi:hypothetical protein